MAKSNYIQPIPAQKDGLSRATFFQTKVLDNLAAELWGLAILMSWSALGIMTKGWV